MGKSGNSVRDSGSDVTIYSRAVKTVVPNPDFDQEIDNLLNKARAQHTSVQPNKQDPRKISSSSEELMDTSDETEFSSDSNFNEFRNIVETKNSAEIWNTPGQLPRVQVMETQRQPNETAGSKLIWDMEQNKATMYKVPGKEKAITSMIDKDYQMIDTHIDESLHSRILTFKYTDFSKLISKSRYVREDDQQRMEIVNKNGLSYLSPISDNNVNISGYPQWEQAFRVYSNIITSRYPTKSSELLQVNHKIHTASTSYAWENVYAYDREFRNHIARHPYRSWVIILQQALTMLLKDRVVKSNNPFSKGNGNKYKKEICKRFNKGKCHLGLSCKYKHRCKVPKCGKFGHGA